ncbi:MAG: hypothetical protein WCW14_04765, partial [Candidatus Paceibacterota bacterium]
TPLLDPSDWNKDGLINEMDENNFPGTRYDATGQKIALNGASKPDYEWLVDQWGLTLSAYAPIIDREGKGVAILAVDVDALIFQGKVRGIFAPYWWFGAVFISLIIGMIILTFFSQVKQNMADRQ